MTYSESWKEQWMMHEWVREFCHVHGFELNAKKCKYVISDFQEGDPRFLWSVDGSEKITPRPCSESFRYLGSMDLDWTKQIQVTTKMIMDWRWKAFARELDPAQ